MGLTKIVSDKVWAISWLNKRRNSCINGNLNHNWSVIATTNDSFFQVHILNLSYLRTWLFNFAFEKWPLVVAVSVILAVLVVALVWSSSSLKNSLGKFENRLLETGGRDTRRLLKMTINWSGTYKKILQRIKDCGKWMRMYKNQHT